MARIPYVDREELPDAQPHLLESVTPREDLEPQYHHLLSGDERNVYRALAHLPSTLQSFRAVGDAVRRETDLEPRERELVILATARELDAAYEWHQHVRIGLNAGLTPEEIRNIADAEYDTFDGDDRALVEYVSGYVHGAVDDRLHDALRERFDVATVVGVGMLAGIYLIIARSMDALAVEPEERFVGWHLEGI